MPYVSGGEITNSRPWTVQRALDAFWSFIFGILFFFKTLLPFLFPDNNTRSRGPTSTGRRSGTTIPGRRIGGVARTSGMSAPPCGASGG